MKKKQLRKALKRANKRCKQWCEMYISERNFVHALQRELHLLRHSSNG